MSALTYREPTSGLTLSVEFYGAYAPQWPDLSSERPKYRYTATWSKDSDNVDLQGTDLYGPAEGRQSWHGDCNNLYRELHAFADFLASDAERYVNETFRLNGGDYGTEYTFDATVAEQAYGVDSELSELTSFLSERERFGQILRAHDCEAGDGSQDCQDYYESLSEEDRAVWELFTAPSTAADYMWVRFEYKAS